MSFLDEWKSSKLCRKFMILFEDKFEYKLNLIDITWEEELSKGRLIKMARKIAYQLHRKLNHEIENNRVIDMYASFLLQDFLKMAKNCIRILRLADNQKLPSKYDIIELMSNRNHRHIAILQRYSQNPEVIDHENLHKYTFLFKKDNNSRCLKNFKKSLSKKDYKIFKKRIKLNDFMADIGKDVMKFNIRFAICTLFLMIDTLKSIMPRYSCMSNFYHVQFKRIINRLKKQYSEILIQIIIQKKNLNIIQKNKIVQNIKSKHNKFYYKGGIFGRFIVSPLNF